MPCYDLFISHAWDHDERYQGVARLLNDAPNFQWRDYSFPREYPAVDPGSEVGRNTLRRILRENVRQSSCFLLIAGMYVNHRYWVQAEIEFAQEFRKPIVGIRRRGQQMTPQVVIDVSHEVVNWNGNSITTAIRNVVSSRSW